MIFGANRSQPLVERNIVVLGLGQSLRRDDAAGLEAVRAWQEEFPQTAARLRMESAELPGLGLLDLLEGAQAAILVDAIQASAPAGTVIRITPEELAAFAPGTGSAHGWGVAETLQLGRSLHPWLAAVRVTLIGIVGGDFAPGAGISPQVRAALPQAVALIQEEVQKLIEPQEEDHVP